MGLSVVARVAAGEVECDRDRRHAWGGNRRFATSFTMT